MVNSLKKIYDKLFSDDISIPQCLQPSHLPGLDGLRGVAIIIVLLSHVFMGTAYASSFAGDTGVEIFFVISGFLITSLLLKEKVTTNRISLKNFYIRRVLRIIPVAYLFLLVLIVLNHFLILKIPFRSFLSASLFFQNIPKLSVKSWYVVHFWSLSVEEQFYLTFPFLLVYSFNKYVKTIIFLILFVPVIGLLGYTNTFFVYGNPAIHIIALIIINLLGKTVCILIGSLFSILLFKGLLVIKDTKFNCFLSFFLLVFAVMIHTQSSVIGIEYCGLFIFPVIIGFVIVLNLNKGSLLTRVLSNPLVAYIGLISYSLYIWQQLFISPYNIMKSVPLIVRIILLFATAIISYHFYEKRFTRLKKRFMLR